VSVCQGIGTTRSRTQRDTFLVMMKSLKKGKKKQLLFSNPSDSEVDKIFDSLARSEASPADGAEKTDLGTVSAQNIAQVL